MAKPRCAVCRSSRFHVDNGQTFCQRGHHQEGITEFTHDFEDVNMPASQTVRVRDTQKQAQIAAQIEALGGSRGLEVFLQAFQLVLRKQRTALVRRMGIDGGDFEGVVKDLWGVRLAALDSSGLKVGLRTEKDARKTTKKLGENRRQDDADIRSQSEDETTTEGETDLVTDNDEGAIGQEAQPPRSLPSLLETIALLYIGVICLKIPLPLSKLHEWTYNEVLHYVGAISQLPAAMKARMAGGYQKVFQPRHRLQPGDLHKCVARLSMVLHDQFDTFELPPLNHHLMLLDYLVRLGLPLQLYGMTEKICKLLKLDFTTSSLRHLGATPLVYELPELQLVALVVVATKLYYPFDGRERFARSAADPAILSLDWQKWDTIHRQSERNKGSKKQGQMLEAGWEFETSVKDVHNLTDDQTDAWLDWYQRYWIDETTAEKAAVGAEVKSLDPGTGVMTAILKKFPLQDSTNADGTNHSAAEQREAKRLEDLVKDVNASLKNRDLAPDDTEAVAPVPRVGTGYAQYRLVKHLEYDKWAKVFHQRAAEAAQVTLPMLLRAVTSLEKRIAAEEGRMKEAKGKRRADSVQSQAMGDWIP